MTHTDTTSTHKHTHTPADASLTPAAARLGVSMLSCLRTVWAFRFLGELLRFTVLPPFALPAAAAAAPSALSAPAGQSAAALAPYSSSSELCPLLLERSRTTGMLC